MKLKQREVILFSVIGGFVAVWLISKVVFGPFHEKLARLKDEVDLREGKLRDNYSLLEKREAIDKEYAKYESFFSVQNSSDEEAVASFLREIEKVSREAGLTVLDMKPQKEVEEDKFFKQYQINLKAEANIKQVVNFLYALHNSSLLISVEKLVLSPKSEMTDLVNVTVTLAGVSFL